MSDNYNEPIDDDDDESGENEDFKNLRAKARKASKYEQENLTLKRELAFIKAGVPMEDPKMGYFVKGYEGDLEPSAIRQAAIEAGFMAAPSQAPDPRIMQAQQGQAAVMQASAGADSGYDPQSALYQLEQAYNEGGTEQMLDVVQQYGFRTSEYDE